jgi:hypothetical protein
MRLKLTRVTEDLILIEDEENGSTDSIFSMDLQSYLFKLKYTFAASQVIENKIWEFHTVILEDGRAFVKRPIPKIGQIPREPEGPESLEELLIEMIGKEYDKTVGK